MPINVAQMMVTATGATSSRSLGDHLRDAVLVADHGTLTGGVSDDSVAVQEAIDYVESTLGVGDVILPAGPIKFSEIVPKSGVNVIGQGTRVIPVANDSTIFTRQFATESGLLCRFENFWIDAYGFTEVTGFDTTFATGFYIDVDFFGCLINVKTDRGGINTIKARSFPTGSQKAGRFIFESTDDAVYGGVFNHYDLFIDGGSGVQDPAVKFRRAVAGNGKITSNNADGTSDFVVIENDCQGLDLFVRAVAYSNGLIMQKGGGVDARPIFNTIRLEADQCSDQSLLMTAGRQNDISVMITSSAVAVDETAIFVNGANNEYNRITGSVSGYYGTNGTGITMVNTVGMRVDLNISGCDRGFVNGGGNTHADIAGDVSELVTSGVVGSWAGVGNRLHDIKGYSGATIVSSPSVPATAAPVTNNTGHDVRVFFTGGTVSTLEINGVGTGYASGMSVLLKVGETIAWTGASAPNWWWIAL